MATFNSNISENDVSKLCSGKSLKTSVKKFLKKCAKGESDKKLFKLCIGTIAKFTNLMYVIIGILILGIKNRSFANVHGALNDAKPTLNEFLALVYLGDGNKIYNYLKSSKGQWFIDLVSALLTADEKDHEKFLQKIKSVNMTSPMIRRLFLDRLELLKALISKMFPRFNLKFYEMAANSQAMYESDNNKIGNTKPDKARDERDEQKILNALIKILRENGNKISLPIKVHVFRSNSDVWKQSNRHLELLNDGEPLYFGRHFLYRSEDNNNFLRFWVEKNGSFSYFDGKNYIDGGHQAVANAIYRFLEDNDYLVTSSKELGRQARNAVIDLLAGKGGLPEKTINKLQLLVLSEVSAKRYGYEKLENDSSGKLWVRKQSNGAFSVAIVLFGNSEEKEAYAKTRDIKSVTGIDKVINSIIEFVESHFYLDAEQINNINNINISKVLRAVEASGCHKSLMNILDLQVMEESSLERLGYEKLNEYLWFNERNDGKIHLAFMWTTHEYNPNMYDPNGQLTDSFKNELAKLIFDYVNSSDQAYGNT